MFWILEPVMVSTRGTPQARATLGERIDRLHHAPVGRLVKLVDPVEHLVDDVHLPFADAHEV